MLMDVSDCGRGSEYLLSDLGDIGFETSAFKRRAFLSSLYSDLIKTLAFFYIRMEQWAYLSYQNRYL
jgi:hypothetical protein